MTTIYVADVLVCHAIRETTDIRTGLIFEIGIYAQQLPQLPSRMPPPLSCTLTEPSYSYDDRNALIESYKALVTKHGGNASVLEFVDTEKDDARDRREYFYRRYGNWNKATYNHENFTEE